MVHYTYNDLVTKIDYIGNDFNNNLRKVLVYLDPKGSDSYKNWDICKEGTYPSGHCVCSKEIHHIHCIKHILTGDTLDIGSSCIGKFSKDWETEAKKREYRWKHPENKYCAVCDNTVSKKSCQKFKDISKVYHIKCIKMLPTCEHCSLYKGYNCKCVYVQCLGIGCSKEINHTCNPPWMKRCKPCYYACK